MNNVELLEITRSEAGLGQIAHFCHAPIDEELSPHAYDMCAPYLGGDYNEEQDRFIRLAVNCFKRKHMSVFEFATLLFRVKCPIFVARQLIRHRNGTFMEKSLRYLDAPDVMQVEGNLRSSYRWFKLAFAKSKRGQFSHYAPRPNSFGTSPSVPFSTCSTRG